MTETQGSEFLSGPPDSLMDCLIRHANASPDREAAKDEFESLTYGQLLESVLSLARQLEHIGIGQGQRVCFLGVPGTQYWTSLLACMHVGAVWTGLNPKYSVGELMHVLGDARPCLTIAGFGSPPRAVAALKAACEGTRMREPLVCNAAGSALALSIPDRCEIRDDDPELSNRLSDLGVCLIVYTSGTTGKPKGALITRRNLTENGWWLARRLGFRPHRTLANLPINHIGCTGDVCATTLVLGGTLVFMANFDPQEAVTRLTADRISWLAQVPAQFQLLFSAGNLQPEHLAFVECITWGGAPMPIGLIERLAPLVPDLFNSYGQTECSGTVTISDRNTCADVLAETVGKPVDPGIIRIAGSDGVAVSSMETGEIQIRGHHVFAGYLGQPIASEAVFTSDGWLRTGDIGRIEADGNIRLVGRTREMFKSGGYSVYPREVEIAIETMPGVEMCAVIGVNDPLWGEVGVAYVQSRNSQVTESSLQAYCDARLARYKVPKKFMVRSELPLLAIGKIDKAALAGTDVS